MRKYILIICAFCLFASCVKDYSDRLGSLADRIEALENVVGKVNANTSAVLHFRDESMRIVSYSATEDGYTIEFSDGQTITITFGDHLPGIVPIIGIDAEGSWIMSVDGGQTFTKIAGSASANQPGGVTPLLAVDDEGYWTISLDGGETYTRILDANNKPINAKNPGSSIGSSFFKEVVAGEDSLSVTLATGEVLTIPYAEQFGITIVGFTAGEKIHTGETLIFPVELNNVAAAAFICPEGWYARLTDESLTITAAVSWEASSAEISLLLTSSQGHLRVVKLLFTYSTEDPEAASCDEWKAYKNQTAENLLLDFSYAGYNHGESAPLNVEALGYKVYNVMDYGAVPNDGLSDRAAFIACLEAALGTKSISNNKQVIQIPGSGKNEANVVIYFPEGEYILHTAADNEDAADVPYGKVTPSICIKAGHVVLRGAGRGKTRLVMQDPALPTSSALYSSTDMLMIKHMSDISSYTTKCVPTAPAAKGSHSLEVQGASQLRSGDWVCLTLDNADPAYVAAEVAPYTAGSSWDIVKDGVVVRDYHQIASVEGSKVTFVEPIMHAVEASDTWEIKKFPHYEGVGVEDLTFVGNSKPDFKHHESWEDDGAYKPLSLMRLTNSWVRRVDFVSVSEALTINSSANISVYDVTISGNRGHSSVRSAGSSRVFIGATYDHADGPSVDMRVPTVGAGQYHAVGVSKPAMGTVLWRNSWGSDSCFESHATQPRATLIDCCKGGWMYSRQGGDATQMPNHLADLTIWNFESTTAFSGSFVWWNPSSAWWKFLPPVIVGFHGAACSFEPSGVKCDSSHGIVVEPESLYEAQLRLRLGYVPAWLVELRALGYGM